MQMNTYGLKKIPRGYFPGVFFFGKQTLLWEEKDFLCFHISVHIQTNEINSWGKLLTIDAI